MNPNTETVVNLQITTNPKGQSRYFANGLRISGDQFGSLFDGVEKSGDWTQETPDGFHRAGATVVHEYAHVINVIGRQRWWSTY